MEGAIQMIRCWGVGVAVADSVTNCHMTDRGMVSLSVLWYYLKILKAIFLYFGLFLEDNIAILE